jgi:hypothetical protein
VHTATQLRHDLFTIQVDGADATREELFPDWGPLDRLGVVVTEPFGAVGAAHLVQVAITCFYDHRPRRRGPDDVIYPEIYAFHVGGPWGDHSAFDFWPQRKEVFVSDDPRDVLDAVNDTAITRLVVVDAPAHRVEHRAKERPTALDRIVGAYAYSASGRVSDPDIVIAGLSGVTEVNARNVLDPTRLLAQHHRFRNPAAKESDPAYGERLNARLTEVDANARAAAVRRREELVVDGRATESYRRLEVDTALDMLSPGRSPVRAGSTSGSAS